MTENIISCASARAAGLVHYFTGKQCKNGHVAARYVVNGACVQCTTEREAIYRANNTKKLRERSAAWRAANPQKAREAQAKHYSKNTTSRLERSAIWRINNLDKERERNARWRAENPGMDAAKASKRRARKAQAIPRWYGEFDELVWQEASHLSKLREVVTGINWHCDHMVALAGRKACGLHVAENCQVIPKTLNLQKHNSSMLSTPFEWVQFL